MRKRAALAITLTLASVVCRTEARGEGAAQPSREERIDAVFAEYDSTSSPGCALAVIEAGETAYQRGYGMANLEHQLALTPSSVFRIASTSKQFTATAIALLAEQGKLSLDDDVRKHLPELAEHDPPVTLRQMVHHTSGIRDYLVLMWLAGADDPDHYEVEEALAMLARQRELNFEPGSDHLYSNAGYFLLSQVVERASGQSLRQFAHENIFAPLGMKDTHYQDDHTEIVKRRADGYAPRDAGGFEISMTTLDMVGDGGVFTTVEDLARWDANFYDNRLGAGGPALIELLTTPGVLTDGEELDYAFGLGVGEYRGLPLVSHGGAFVGFRANLLRFPEERVSVICLCNHSSSNPSRLARSVADVYLEDRFPAGEDAAASADPDAPAPAVELSAEELSGYTGLYFNEVRRTVRRIIARDGDLLYSRGGDSETPLAALGDGRFRMVGPPVEVEVAFGEGADGKRRMTVTVAGQEPGEYVAVDEVTYSTADLATFLGTYYSAELDVRYTLVEADGSLVVEKPGDDFELASSFADFFTGEDGYLGVEFEHGADGAPAGFVLQAGRVRNLRFERLPSGPGAE